jgi:hypothetical protein
MPARGGRARKGPLGTGSASFRGVVVVRLVGAGERGDVTGVRCDRMAPSGVDEAENCGRGGPETGLSNVCCVQSSRLVLEEPQGDVVGHRPYWPEAVSGVRWQRESRGVDVGGFFAGGRVVRVSFGDRLPAGGMTRQFAPAIRRWLFHARLTGPRFEAGHSAVPASCSGQHCSSSPGNQGSSEIYSRLPFHAGGDVTQGRFICTPADCLDGLSLPWKSTNIFFEQRTAFSRWGASNPGAYLPTLPSQIPGGHPRMDTREQSTRYGYVNNIKCIYLGLHSQ